MKCWFHGCCECERQLIGPLRRLCHAGFLLATCLGLVLLKVETPSAVCVTVSQIVDLGSFACQLSFAIFWVSLERMNLQAVGSFGGQHLLDENLSARQLKLLVVHRSLNTATNGVLVRQSAAFCDARMCVLTRPSKEGGLL